MVMDVFKRSMEQLICVVIFFYLFLLIIFACCFIPWIAYMCHCNSILVPKVKKININNDTFPCKISQSDGFFLIVFCSALRDEVNKIQSKSQSC